MRATRTPMNAPPNATPTSTVDDDVSEDEVGSDVTVVWFVVVDPGSDVISAIMN